MSEHEEFFTGQSERQDPGPHDPDFGTDLGVEEPEPESSDADAGPTANQSAGSLQVEALAWERRGESFEVRERLHEVLAMVRKKIFRQAMGYAGGNKADADDLTATCLSKLIGSKGYHELLEPDAYFMGFASTILRNHFYDDYRRKKRKNTGSLSDPVDETDRWINRGSPGLVLEPDSEAELVMQTIFENLAQIGLPESYLKVMRMLLEDGRKNPSSDGEAAEKSSKDQANENQLKSRSTKALVKRLGLTAEEMTACKLFHQWSGWTGGNRYLTVATTIVRCAHGEVPPPKVKSKSVMRPTLPPWLIGFPPEMQIDRLVELIDSGISKIYVLTGLGKDDERS